MSIKPPPVTLINLAEFMPFNIDDKMKEELCFSETLIISCGHFEGQVDGESESEWTCRSSTSSEPSHKEAKKSPTLMEESKKKVSTEEEDSVESDFQLFFFPDCKKPPSPQHSDGSIIMVDGFPTINKNKVMPVHCTCKYDEKDECECFIKIPCHCGATRIEDCVCRHKKNVCVCDPLNPHPDCICQTNANVCVCAPDNVIKPECTCETIEKPCLCGKYPSPTCICKHEPPFTPSSDSVSSFRGEGEYTKYPEEESEKDAKPCLCQEEPKKICYCKKGQDCICRIACVCGVQPTCQCLAEDGVEVLCKETDNKSICECPVLPKICTCGAETSSKCKCFPANKSVCTCGNPNDCNCFATCECTDPCLCDNKPVIEKACTCLPASGAKDIICTCPKEEDRVIKKVRAGKQGYRWCHEVDPYHTFFDYAYDRADKIRHIEPEEKKLVITDEKKRLEEEFVKAGLKPPPYVKTVKKPCLDCCSAVGGISISVETLGEDKDKFLVQVVTHTSKEGAKTGSKLVSILDCKLHTMEENRIEFITKKDLTKEKRNYMAICTNGYYNKVTRICGDKHVAKRIYHTFEKAQNFLLEGASFVLMRYFGLSRWKGNIKTDTVMMDGLICQSLYVCHGVCQAVVNNTPMYVVKVERHIIEPSGFIHQSLTVVSLRGYLVSHEWADTCYVIHLNPLLKINAEKDIIEEHAPLRENWRNDLQLLSDYLDFKTVRTSEGGRYVTESGALTGAVRDYLQAILLLRPQDTVHFTRHYFGAILSALDLPHDEYFDPTSRHVRYYFFEEFQKHFQCPVEFNRANGLVNRVISRCGAEIPKH